LVLDGVLAVDVDGEPLAEFGPGAILGERAILEGGKRTSTMRAVTKCRVAVARGDQLDRQALGQRSAGHRREEERKNGTAGAVASAAYAARRRLPAPSSRASAGTRRVSRSRTTTNRGRCCSTRAPAFVASPRSSTVHFAARYS